MNPRAKFVPVILTTWFCLALATGISGKFEPASASTVALTVWVLTALVLLGCWKIPALTHWTKEVSLKWLIVLHVARFVGFYFLFLCRHGGLACGFARPAGIGDIAIAIGAACLLLLSGVRREWWTAIFVWNVLGFLDIGLVVFNALRVGRNDWLGMAPLRALPLILLPTYLVPLIIVSHILIFVRLRAVKPQPSENVKKIGVFLALFAGFPLAHSITFGAAGDNIADHVPIRYVAIGDSYTIGEGAKKEEAWPSVLTKHLQEKGVNIELIANPSVTGWTTQMAIDRELPVFIESKPTFATLLIGVNDWVQGVDEKTFRQRFTFLVDRMLEHLPNKQRLLIVTIPDFGVTPTGSRYSRGRNISEGISSFNKIILEEANKRGLQVVDIFPLSKKMQNDLSLVAGDGLHPSAKEYAEWEKIIRPVGLKSLAK